MAWPISASAAEVLVSGRRRAELKVEVWNGNVYLQDIEITGGSVSEDETASPRRTCTLTCSDMSLVPSTPTDLLHPLSGNELRPYWGIVIPGAVSYESTVVETTTITTVPIPGDAGSGDGSGGTTDGSWDDGGTWDSGGTWDDSAGGAGGTTYDSGGTYDDGSSYDSPGGIASNDDGSWDSGGTWDSGTSWDDAGGTETVTTTVDTVTTTVVEEPDTVEWVPLGVFRISQPSTTYTGSSTVITINGRDRSAEISLRQWTFPYTIPAGLTVDQAVTTILNERWGDTTPALTFNVTPTSVVVPTGTVLGVTFTSSGATTGNGSGNDPWADCVTLAQSVGNELLFDRQGIVVMRAVPETSTVPQTATFVDGANSTLVAQVVRELDETSVVNQVIVIGTGATVTNTDGSVSPGPPVTATASYLDPELGINGVLGARTKFITNSAISDSGTAQVAANAALTLALSSLDDTSFEAIPDPTVEAGDCDQLVEPAVKASNTYIVSAISHPLDFTNPMQITNRPSAVNI